MINITSPFLPPKEEYIDYVNQIWKRNWLTNNGPLVNELELSLKNYLNLKHLLFVSNGTIALQIAIKALNLKGEIITTPFSYVATTSSIVWEGCKPVFVDIDTGSLNINPSLIEKAITKETSAILATHVFGNPCEIDKIEEIAKKHHLKVIYDAAHAFGTFYKEKSVFNFGDISTASFHATKIFHTIEGGAVVTKDPSLLRKMVFLRNFGHDGPYRFNGLGINGKNSEFHAAMGLCNLKYIHELIKKRQEQSSYYDEKLCKLRIRKQIVQKDASVNCSYYPIIFESEDLLLKSKEALERHKIFTRRYFYPSLSQLDYVGFTKVPTVDNISSRIMCLPLYHDLTTQEQDMIARILLRVQNY